MTRARHLFFAVPTLWLLLSAAAGRAASITVRESHLEVAVTPRDERATAVFSIENGAAVPITVHAEPACSCTSIEWTDRTFQPGQALTLTTSIDVTRMTAERTTEYVRLVYGDRDEDAVRLSVTIVNPKYVTADENVVLWSYDDRRPRVVRLSFAPEHKIVILEAREPSTALCREPVIKPRKGGADVVLEPVSSGASAAGRLVITYTVDASRPLTTSVLLRRLPPPDQVKPVAASGAEKQTQR